MILTIVFDTLFGAIFSNGLVSQLFSRSVLILILLLANTTIFKLKFGNMTNRIGLGLLLSIPVLIFVVLNALSVEPDNLMKASMQAYLLAVISTIAAVTWEEILMRGILLNGFLRAWSHKTNVVWLSVIWSSLIFSIAHAPNMLAGQALDATIQQLLYTLAMGFFFAALYLRTNNLLIPIIGHFVINIVSELQELGVDLTQVANEATEETNNLTAFIAIGVASLILIIFSLIYLRKKKHSEVTVLNLNIK
ncbi:CPBP family intramembrane metalloprotease [Bacillus cereus]|nr:CPBP family intramembrane metalloprotease [Bacillus cereus]MEB8905280.1 CPBP family intramembrane metalloprotease [Bacillus cereus]MEB9923045.1 CPBP family intramembrane metalloprotease [Bacillus cereus]MEB9986217.1 CPBP family intramembrane metalloprotease [Bacillus cereus]MEB9991435.1 CPBP family intramembrane metalloprotease [Bacillus cereus]